jgi:hypothetical protein
MPKHRETNRAPRLGNEDLLTFSKVAFQEGDVVSPHLIVAFRSLSDSRAAPGASWALGGFGSSADLSLRRGCLGDEPFVIQLDPAANRRCGELEDRAFFERPTYGWLLRAAS